MNARAGGPRRTSAGRQERAEDEVGIHDEGAAAGRVVLVAEDREVEVRAADDVARRADVPEPLALRDVVAGAQALLVPREVCVKERVTARRVPAGTRPCRRAGPVRGAR